MALNPADKLMAITLTCVVGYITVLYSCSNKETKERKPETDKVCIIENSGLKYLVDDVNNQVAGPFNVLRETESGFEGYIGGCTYNINQKGIIDRSDLSDTCTKNLNNFQPR
jgi:hypothetical protein